MSAISFQIEARARRGRVRAGVLETPHGDIHTPAFVPVGTKAGVKGVLPNTLRELGAEVVLANTYHLYLQPGEKVVREAGGLAKFMNWNKPTMTDSGGFQVFSLGAGFGKKLSKVSARSNLVETEISESQHGRLAKVDEEGVSFTSHIDGSSHRFTPERSVEIQHALGADIFFAFDECTSPTAEYAYQREAMERTHRWAERSLKTHRQNADARENQGIFGIVQGGRHEDLRRESARAIAGMGFDGFGIGGSFSKEDMKGALQAAVSELPEELPRHFLGIGEPGDLLEGIAEGMDLFDCVAPTRLGRHGSIYTKHGLIHLTNEKYRNDFTPLETESLTGFMRAYVSHLLRAGEMLGPIIASMHNLKFILNLVAGARQAILDGRFDEYRDEFVGNFYKS